MWFYCPKIFIYTYTMLKIKCMRQKNLVCLIVIRGITGQKLNTTKNKRQNFFVWQLPKLWHSSIYTFKLVVLASSQILDIKELHTVRQILHYCTCPLLTRSLRWISFSMIITLFHSVFQLFFTSVPIYDYESSFSTLLYDSLFNKTSQVMTFIHLYIPLN